MAPQRRRLRTGDLLRLFPTVHHLSHLRSERQLLPQPMVLRHPFHLWIHTHRSHQVVLLLRLVLQLLRRRHPTLHLLLSNRLLRRLDSPLHRFMRILRQLQLLRHLSLPSSRRQRLVVKVLVPLHLPTKNLLTPCTPTTDKMQASSSSSSNNNSNLPATLRIKCIPSLLQWIRLNWFPRANPPKGIPLTCTTPLVRNPPWLI